MSPDPTAPTPGTVLVTGAASGLGAAVVEAVRAAGGSPLDRPTGPVLFIGRLVEARSS